MSRRSAGTCAASIAVAAALSRRTTLCRIAACISRSVDMGLPFLDALNDRSRAIGFADQHVKRRHLVVPLDQCGPRAEPADRLAIQRPYLLADSRCMVIDAER